MLRPLQRVLLAAAVCLVVGVGVWSYQGSIQQPSIWPDKGGGPRNERAVVAIKAAADRVDMASRHVEREIAMLRAYGSNVNLASQLIDEYRRKSRSQEHRVAAGRRAVRHVAKPPPAPPTEPKPRELPSVGDATGLTKLPKFDRNSMKPIPVLLIACNRPTVSRALDLLIKYRWSSTLFPIIVSQDCNGHPATKSVIERYVTAHGVKHLLQPNHSEPHLNKKERRWAGYYKIARHYKFALDAVDRSAYDSVIIVEDDLDVAPDFFEYMVFGRHLLQHDKSLFCVSAWNDNGKAQHVDDPHRLYRTDFFGGLGWMILREMWDDELSSKWTNRYWDDWMRLPAQRKGRACIRPEVARSKTFGEKGVSKGQFYKKYLKFIKLNDVVVNFTQQIDTVGNHLLKQNYDQPMLDHVLKLEALDVSGIVQGHGLPKNLSKEYRIEYTSNRHFARIAKSLGIMEDNKEGVFRTAYLGVVSIVWRPKDQPESTPLRLHIVPHRPWLGYQP